MIKYSRQRESIVNFLASRTDHPTAETIYQNIKKEFPNISLGTVYRNLAQLAENGDILKISTSANKEHFDGFVHRHFHFVCNKCDKIYDVDLDGMDEIKNQAAEKLNADIEDYSLIFYGICENCSSKKNNSDIVAKVSENNITTMMITHNLKQSLTTGTRTIMLDSGEIILDLSGEERKNTTMEDMIKMYSIKKQKEFDNDRILLSQ